MRINRKDCKTKCQYQIKKATEMIRNELKKKMKNVYENHYQF